MEEPNTSMSDHGAAAALPENEVIDEANFSLSLRRLQARQSPSVRPASISSTLTVPVVQRIEAK